MSDVVGKLEEARRLALTDKVMFPKVVNQILVLSANPDLVIRRWCVDFLQTAFSSPDELADKGVLTELAIELLDPLRNLLSERDPDVYKGLIDLVCVVYRIVFRFVAENDGSSGVTWQKLTELKRGMLSKWGTQFPFEELYDGEHDMMRNLDNKIQLLKFLVLVVDYQLRSLLSRYFSLSRVGPSHTLIKVDEMEGEAGRVLDSVLALLRESILVTPLVTAVLNQLAVLVRRKRQFMDKIIPLLEQFESVSKERSNYESLETFKLSRKYVDRTLRVLLSYMTKIQVVPPKYQAAVGRKIALLQAHGDEIRKKNILQPLAGDAEIKVRKSELFPNPLKRLKLLTYKNLYCLTEPDTEINNFDMRTLTQPILITMVLSALSKAEPRRLASGLDIIAERYTAAVGENQLFENVEEIKEEGERFEPETQYTLPAPEVMSPGERKENVSLIVKNFFALAKNGKAEEPELGRSELEKVAIASWRPDTWHLLLTRLATRGMPEALGDMIRKALFDHFMENVQQRVDLVIDWLNEEWFAEKLLHDKKVEEENEEENEEKVGESKESEDVPTPRYNKWAQQVIDALIPFLESNDRKIFLRLLSDLPYLNADMVGGIKSLCIDPARLKIGFLALHFLIMYRPPVKDACVAILKELSADEQEDLREEAKKVLERCGVTST